MRFLSFCMLCAVLFLSFYSGIGQPRTSINNTETIKNRISPPDGFTRLLGKPDSFASYLQNLPLKPTGTNVHLFNGQVKLNNNIYFGVVAMDIDPVDLQQCADAVMRLRGEYLYARDSLAAIHFNFVSDGKPRYFLDYASGDTSYAKFRKYMRFIFSYANTASLYHELIPVADYSQMQIGDVFIQTRNPYGHAVIVVDMARNPQTGETVFLLAQSYMPAQETQILINPNNDGLNPWYLLKEGPVRTPEWNFTTGDIRRFD